MFIASFLFMFASSAYAVDGYQQAKWGMTIEQVKATTTTTECSGAYKVESYFCAPIELLGTKGEVVYIFSDGKLIRANLNFRDVQPRMFDELKVLLTEKYGLPIVDATPPVQGMFTITASWVSEGITLQYIKMGMSVLSVSYDGTTAVQAEAAKNSL
jgi:hypothetical protein